MINVSMEMEQYDCPFVHASDSHDVAFSSVHCDAGAGRTEVRMVAEADDRGALESGLSTVRGHDGVEDYELFSKVDNVAKFRTVVGPTAAMHVVQSHDGYITGPFYAEAGTETWHVGFDESEDVDGALAALEHDHEFDVVGRDDTDDAELHQLVQNAGAAMTLIEGCKDLSDVERETLEAAVSDGYYENPRDATLGTLADRFDVSKPAVSKNLRRGEQKMIQRVIDAIDDME
ncbi:helix-turn-helix domain-containing protein [Halobacterium bonnevillei]|uniref:Helix-turn-helix domain-containing protein n=1 Tax=Halobacterium bonnevillei TaxID=2692200 RepID=A0A6B0SR71_9EURY|nr:helix-turn-helix domain-containing protein [Halobacterium bonnevillei]MXR20089.1 helix-turn-helix domain-containing protein [Halobacterium bonnevillei]